MNLTEWQKVNDIDSVNIVRIAHSSGVECIARLKELSQWKTLPATIILHDLPILRDAERVQLTTAVVPYRYVYRVHHAAQTLELVTSLGEVAGDWLLSAIPIANLVDAEKAKQEK